MTHRNLLWLLVCLIAIGVGCSEPTDDSQIITDASLSIDALIDMDQGTIRDVSLPDASPLDSGLVDVAMDIVEMPDAGPLLPPIRLRASEATATGRHTPLSDARVILDPNGQLEWRYPPNMGGERVIIFQAVIWRLEDGLMEIQVDDETHPAMVRGDGTGRPAVAQLPDDAWTLEGAGVDAEVPPVYVTLNDAGGRIMLRAVGGSVVIDGIHLRDGRDTEVAHSHPEPWTPTDTLQYAPCEDPGCDDGVELTRLIAESPVERLQIDLVGARYHLRTSIRIERSWVRLKGPQTASQTVLFWDPLMGSGRRGAVEAFGPGLVGQPLTLRAELARGERRFIVEGDVPPDLRWVRITTDDFGDVPPVCVNGRDVERYHRHQRQLARVLSVDGQNIVLDRPVALDAPIAANPRLIPAELLEGVEVINLRIEANCPEAIRDSFDEAACTNTEVLDDDGVMMVWTLQGRLDRVSGQGFGKFTIQATDALETLITDCEMSYPAAYGSGGQGYGVHLIGASRSLVIGERVNHARHGVVVDFGSSDSQVLDSEMSDMNQALVDVHGESSRDTLIRGNTLTGATVGVTVGGGGRAVHCNDEPRHHIERNRITDCSLAGVSVADYTREVTVRFNQMDDCSTFVSATFGARDIDVERNVFGDAAITPITVALTDSGGVRVTRNVFEATCGPEDAFLALGDAEPPVLRDNQFSCPMN
jgi:hypothetical protein